MKKILLFLLLGFCSTVKGQEVQELINGEWQNLVPFSDSTTTFVTPFQLATSQLGSTAILDSVSNIGGHQTINMVANTIYQVIGAVDTLNFPSGITGNWIEVDFPNAVSGMTVTLTGTGSSTAHIPYIFTSGFGYIRIYHNVGGNWR